MKIREILQKIQLGSPVAEYDEDLQNYFVITDACRHITSGKIDLIAGDKGTGKTAIFKYLQHEKQRMKDPHRDASRDIRELRNVEVIPGFNPSGEPLFRRLGDESKLTEGQYITIWKMYFLSLAGNWLIRNSRSQKTPVLHRLEALLSKVGLLSIDDSAGTVFSRLMDWLRENATPKALSMEVTFNESGIPVFAPRIELGKAGAREAPSPETVSHSEAFDILNAALVERNIILWIALDRLDEAFVGRPDIETLALRALIRTFSDISFSHLRLKLFVRNDLFRKITREGFVNLTHVNARRKEIIWDEEDLMAMLAQRIRNNREVFREIGVNTARIGDGQLFRIIFPPKVHPSSHSAATWKWMLNQIRDGNSVKPPRNLIDLCIMAQEEQLRRERRTPREYAANLPIIEAEALKDAAVRLSRQRIEDTLMAEYGEDVKRTIKAFRNGKAEHNDESLAALFGMDVMAARFIAKVLMDIGFLEETGGIYKVPPLYRPGLNITKGKAFNNHDSPA